MPVSPWPWVGESENDYACAIYDSSGHFVMFLELNCDEKTNRENAQLVIAAPMLVSALKKLMAVVLDRDGQAGKAMLQAELALHMAGNGILEEVDKLGQAETHKPNKQRDAGKAPNDRQRGKGGERAQGVRGPKVGNTVDGRPGGGRVPGGASIPLSPCCDAPMLQSGRKAICTVCRGEIRRCK